MIVHYVQYIKNIDKLISLKNGLDLRTLNATWPYMAVRLHVLSIIPLFSIYVLLDLIMAACFGIGACFMWLWKLKSSN